MRGLRTDRPQTNVRRCEPLEPLLALSGPQVTKLKDHVLLLDGVWEWLRGEAAVGD